MGVVGLTRNVVVLLVFSQGLGCRGRYTRQLKPIFAVILLLLLLLCSQNDRYTVQLFAKYYNGANI